VGREKGEGERGRVEKYTSRGAQDYTDRAEGSKRKQEKAGEMRRKQSKHRHSDQTKAEVGKSRENRLNWTEKHRQCKPKQSKLGEIEPVRGTPLHSRNRCQRPLPWSRGTHLAPPAMKRG
jgi:hypothetical protein